MHIFSMWKNSIHYENGWFIFADGENHCSVISIQRARNLERDYTLYQASQDVNRGGVPLDVAYESRGIKSVKDENGMWQYDLVSYAADYAISKGSSVELKGILEIPSRIGQFTIDMVYDEAFSGCTELEKVILPETITSIGDRAFHGCAYLVDVTFPRKLAHIGKDAFAGTQMELAKSQSDPVQIKGTILIKADPAIRGEYRIPEFIKVIGDYAFNGCKDLTRLILHDNITSIGQNAFEDCTSLAEIQMPKSVESLGLFAFNGCSKLESIVVPDGVRYLDHFHRCAALKRVSIPVSVESIGWECFSETALMNDFLAGEEDQFVVDHWLIRYKVNSAGSLSMSDDVVGIADQDWTKHSLQNDFRGLKSVHLSPALKYMGSYAFERTGITDIALPEGLLFIGMSCFRGTNLRSITIPSSVRELGLWALMDCEHLEKVIFLGDTKIVGFAITGRKDKKTITIVARQNSNPYTYVKSFGLRYRLQFKRAKSFFHFLFP